MSAVIGIRREDKNEWERRVPLTPADAAAVQAERGHRIVVQPSPIRVFDDDAYRDAGLEVSEDALDADILIGVKEIPPELYRPAKVYVNFSHTIKGQPYNMPLLKRYMELGCSLVDYECIADDDGRRLIFFSLHAGYAGMIESLRALGLRLASRGAETPLREVKPAYEYADLADAERHLRGLGKRLAAEGIPGGGPLVIGFAGYGNVSQGAQHVLSWLPRAEVSVADLPRAADAAGGLPLVQVVFKEADMVRPRGDHAFDLQDYYDNPERYEGRFAEHLPYLDMLVNTIFWTERYPRLVTKAWAAEQFRGGGAPRLQVIGDISIDIEGSIEPSLKATYPDAPCFVYDPATDSASDGVAGEGLVIMAVDNLPCELPRESSEHFSGILRDMVGDLGDADWSADFADLDLPPHLKRAVIVHRGKLTPAFARLSEFL
jgi:alpha-aminoadipic semialdehyde synthase